MTKFTFLILPYFLTLGIFPEISAQTNTQRAQQNFTDVPNSLAPVYNSTCKWGDYDNDSDLDILLMGYLEISDDSGRVVFNEEVTRIYQNNAGEFTDIEADLPGLYVGAADWGDYDNDGDLDLILCGASGSEYVTKLFNNDSGAFNDTNISLQEVRYGSVAWGDYDNDGDLDLLLSGATSTISRITILYRNDDGVFGD